MDKGKVIGLSEVTLKRGGIPLLKDVNWTVTPGQNWTILGPNGSGKTLLLRIVTGYIWPTEGQVTVLERRLGQVDIRELRKRIGWVSQALADLMPGDTTLLGTILSGPMASLGLYSDPSPELVEKAETIAEDFKLADKLKRQFFLLSSGERQRVLLARAALTEPDLLILDEPMSNLDMGGREMFLDHVKRLAALQKAPTIILTTHNTLEIGPFITHSLILKGGTVLSAGPADAIITKGNLSGAFDMPLKVERTANGRYLAYLEEDPTQP